MKIGILHPGAMGSDLGQTLSSMHQVTWASEGRSAVTQARAAAAGLLNVSSLTNLVYESDVIVSLCPPHAAMEVARSVAFIRSHGFLYVEANSVAPQTVRRISELFSDSLVIDATLTGAPHAGNTTLWVSGPRGAELHPLFQQTRIRCHCIGEEIGQASAFKMCAGLRSKVIPAIWATLIDAASAYGPAVEAALHAHLQELGYSLDHEAAKISNRAGKAGRWIGEMEESAKAMEDVGLPSGFSEAAAITYRRIVDRMIGQPAELAIGP